MSSLKEGCRSSSESSVQSICFGVGCRCRMLKALLRIFLRMTRGHMGSDTYIRQAFGTCI